MGEPFRDAEGSALERVQALEDELEDVRAQVRTRVAAPDAASESVSGTALDLGVLGFAGLVMMIGRLLGMHM